MSVLTLEEVRVRPETAEIGGGSHGESSAAADIGVEIGIWLSGIESFLISGHHSFAQQKAVPDSSKEFRLIHAALERSALLCSRLLSETGRRDAATNFGELREMSLVLRDSLLLSNGLIQSTHLGAGEWKAWSGMLLHRFRDSSAFAKLIRFAEDAGEKNLPPPLLSLVESDNRLTDEHAELALVLPHFAKILKWLGVVGKMLEADEPLKPALLIFARVNEQIFELTTYINNRLEFFPDNEAELFTSLDAASYTASIELKKVYSHELAGLARVRPSPSIYARMETAYSILTEGFQQILAGFARLIDPDADIFALFPSFQLKLEQSIILRSEMSELAKLVQAAEAEPEKKQIENMNQALRKFTAGPVRYLFYKDTETVERFIEEILVTTQNKDLVPILHRFGAYLETLFGQVSLRAVLEKYPFETKN